MGFLSRKGPIKPPGIHYSHLVLKYVCAQFFQMEAYLEVKGRDLGESISNEIVSGIWSLLVSSDCWPHGPAPCVSDLKKSPKKVS